MLLFRFEEEEPWACVGFGVGGLFGFGGLSLAGFGVEPLGGVVTPWELVGEGDVRAGEGVEEDGIFGAAG